MALYAWHKRVFVFVFPVGEYSHTAFTQEFKRFVCTKVLTNEEGDVIEIRKGDTECRIQTEPFHSRQTRIRADSKAEEVG